MSWYAPTPELNDEARDRGLKFMFYDGLFSNGMAILVTGAFLPGMALALGANNFVIGLLASMAPVAQMAQIPAILLVEKIGLRKLMTVVFAAGSRLCLVLAALTPFILPAGLQVLGFTVFMGIFFLGGSFAGCSWNSWIKDIVPDERMGTYLASRLAAATALGAVLSLVAGFGIDGLTAWTGRESVAYGIIFLVAAGFGLLGVGLLAPVPEPQMPSREPGTKWLTTLLMPVKDTNFRRLLTFSAAWSFTVVMSGAFFTVYMLKRIGISMSGVILLAVVSQVANIYFFNLWGRIADRFSNKSVLAVSVPLFILLLILWPFTTLPERYSLTIPLLIFIHVVGGVATAGFNLCAANIALRLAPHGKATAYLGTNAFCAGLAAAIAPILGGAIGGFFELREISLNILYSKNISIGDTTWKISALSFRGIDFIFFAAVLSGLYSWHRLSLIEEDGTVSEAEVRNQVLSSVRNSLFSASGLNMGMRRMTAFPYELLKKTTQSTGSIISKAVKKTAKKGGKKRERSR